ncbi:hypothetical protein ACIRJ3_05445 [Streptomyces anulatus]|uniref:hypothetical protein n=1 Tax=Streptomyces sp. NPDC052179 TaxID=3155680 RepID=UPI0034190742
MTICTRNLRKAPNRRGATYADAFLKEMFRLQRRQHVRGFAGDFRPSRKGGPRALLPIV